MSDLRNRFGQLGMEALGAFMLVTTISISATTAPAAAPIAVGVILAAMIYAGGHVSGAHYNPGTFADGLPGAPCDTPSVGASRQRHSGRAWVVLCSFLSVCCAVRWCFRLPARPPMCAHLTLVLCCFFPSGLLLDPLVVLFASRCFLAPLPALSFSFRLRRPSSSPRVIALRRLLALTLALFLRGGIALADVLLYMAAQLAGAVVGGLIGGLITGHTIAPKMGASSNHLQAFLAEAVFTGALAFVFLSTTSSEASKGNPYFGAAIASVVTVAGYTIAGVSGAVLNPAVGTGLVLTHNWLKVGYLVWLVAAQVVGAAGGVGAFWFVAPSDFAEVSDEARSMFEAARLRAREGASEARGLLPHRGEAGPSQG